MLIDTHCHLNFHAFDKDLDDVVRRAQEAGVEKIIIPGTDLASSKRAVEIAQMYPGFCYAAVGIHPHHAQDPHLLINDELKTQLEALLISDGVVAAGEIGMDYYRYSKTKYENTALTDEIKQKQKHLLCLQLELAVIHNKPVILHCREAFDDMVQTISTISRNFPAPSVKTNYIKHDLSHGVWHCFGGNAKQLQDILTMGYYVGFDGNITYSSDYSPLVASAPLNRILLETDSPYLTPVPHRGTRNEPMHLPLVAEVVARYHSSPLSEVIQQSTKNAATLFSIEIFSPSF